MDGPVLTNPLESRSPTMKCTELTTELSTIVVVNYNYLTSYLKFELDSPLVVDLIDQFGYKCCLNFALTYGCQ